jgi:hypothetical protein
MCECQPDIVMFAEFEPPLFRRYDLAVEFARRRRRVKDHLVDRWAALQSESDDQITAEVLEICSIEPLRLAIQHERLVVEPSGYDSDTYEPCYFYRKFIPFAGDRELWDLSPGAAAAEVEAEGAICYLEYVTSTCHSNEEWALKQLATQVEAANRMIALQEGRIRLFNESLVKTVDRELRKLRRAQSGEWWESAAGST